MVESSALLKRHTPKGYRGFESLPHRFANSPQNDRKPLETSGLRCGPKHGPEPQNNPKNAAFCAHKAHKAHKENGLQAQSNGLGTGGVRSRSMFKSKATETPRFPYRFERNGRVGQIKHWPARNVFATYFRYAGRAVRNTFSTFQAAYLHLDHEFSTLDAAPQNSLVLNPLRSDLRTYSELEALLRQHTNSRTTLREAVEFYLAHHEASAFKPRIVSDCIRSFHEAEARRKVSPSHAKMSKSRLQKFSGDFGAREIHTVRATEIEEWLRQFENAKTSNHYRGIVVSLFLYARDVLQAIPEGGKVAPQRVQAAKVDPQTKVCIYTPGEIASILSACVEHDQALIPVIVLGTFLGLRPNEIHGEEARYDPLTWEAIDWARSEIHVEGQKVRGLRIRDLQIPPNALAWLRPFEKCTGKIWGRAKSYNRRVKKLIEGNAKLKVAHDGFRHSYASYRIRMLKGNLNKLAEEMGNSPREIINSYKRNVRDDEAEAYFNIYPGTGYATEIGCSREPSEPFS